MAEPTPPVEDVSAALVDELDRNLNMAKWNVPVKPDGALPLLLQQAIGLAQQGIIDRPHLNRFINVSVPSSFDKILLSSAVRDWKHPVNDWIRSCSRLLVQLIALRIQHENTTLLNCLAWALDPHSNFHITNALEEIPADEPRSSGPVYATVRNTRRPFHWLVDFLNHFGAHGGFDRLQECLLAPTNAGSVAVYLRPFGASAPYLTPDVLKKSIVGVYERGLGYVRSLEIEALKTQAMAMAKHDVLYTAFTAFKAIQRAVSAPLDDSHIFSISKLLDGLLLDIVLKLLKGASFNGVMYALTLIRNIIIDLTPLVARSGEVQAEPEPTWLSQPVLVEWLLANKIIPLLFSNNLHQAQYVSKLEDVVRFVMTQNSLSAADLSLIWNSQVGKHEAIVTNIFNLLAKLANAFDTNQLDHLFRCFQLSWGGTVKNMERLIEFVRRLAEDDTEGKMALKVLDTLWTVAHDPETPNEIVTLALSSHVKILDLSNISHKNLQRENWLTRCLEELHRGTWVVPAITLFRDIAQLYPDEQRRGSQVRTRADLWRDLGARHDVKKLALDCLSAYMTKSKEFFAKKPKDMDPTTAFINGRFHHIQNVETRLSFIKSVHYDLGYFIADKDAFLLWDTLIDKPTCSWDREFGYTWFTNAIDDLDSNVHRLLFAKRILKIDVRTMTATAFECVEKYFNQLNIPAVPQQGQTPSQTTAQASGKPEECPNLLGLDYLWSLTFESLNEDIAQRARTLIKTVHITLSLRLKSYVAAQLHDKFLTDCMDRINKAMLTVKPAKITKETQPALRAIEKVLLVLQEYVTENDEAYCLSKKIRRHDISFRGEELSLEIHGVGQPFRLFTHSNETLLAFRDQVAARLDVSERFLAIYHSDCLLRPDQNHSSLGELAIFPESSIIANLLNAQDTPCPPYVPPVDSDPASERLLPGYRLVSRPDFLERLFELTEWPVPTIQQLSSKLLLCAPSDPQELKKLVTRVRVGGGEESKVALQAFLLRAKGTFRRLYNVQLLSSVIHPCDTNTHTPDASVTNFRQAFLEASGLQTLVEILARCNEVSAASDSVQDLRVTWTIATALLHFLLWRGISVDLQVIRQSALTLEIPEDRKSEYTKKVFQEQKMKILNVLVGGINAKVLVDALTNICWRAATANWQAKSTQELSLANPTEVPSLEDNWLAHHALSLLAFLFQVKQEAIGILADAPFFDAFLRDTLLQCKSQRVRHAFYNKFFDSASKNAIARFWTASVALLASVVERNAETCFEYFSFLTGLLPSASSTVMAPSDVLQHLTTELAYLKAVKARRDEVIGQPLIAGHLSWARALLSLNAAAKETAGSELIPAMIDDFLFPASKLMISLKRNQIPKEFTIPDILPKCFAPPARVAAFEFLVELCTGSVNNLECTIKLLTEIHESAVDKITEWEYHPPISPKLASGHVGIKNAGMTCYMNATLQQLFMQPFVRSRILAADCIAEEERAESVLYQIQRMFAHLSFGHMQYFVPKEFWKNYRHWGQPVNVREQQDALEFYNSLIDQLDEGLAKISQPRIFSEAFGGLFVDQKIIKSGCTHTFEREEPFSSIAVAVRNNHRLEDSLEQYVKGDLLEGDNAYKCETCNEKRDCIKRTCIKKLPLSLVVHLKRFDFDWETSQPVKFNDMFEFPRELDMGPYTAEGIKYREENNGQAPPKHPDHEYTLVGVAVHSGQASSGHYYSFIKARDEAGNPTAQWLKFDDSEVTPCEIADDTVLQSECFGGEYFTEVWDSRGFKSVMKRRWRSWNAYMLFYERVSIRTNDALLAERNRPTAPTILRLVQEENLKFHHQREVFNSEYFSFVKQLSDANTEQLRSCPATERDSPAIVRIGNLSATFSSQFLLGIGLRTDKSLRGYVHEWPKVISTLINANATSWRVFVGSFVTDAVVMKTFLLECNNLEVRQCFADTVREILTHAYIHEAFPAAEQFANDLFVQILIPMLQKDVVDNWKHFGQYFKIFADYADLGVFHRDHLIRLGVLELFVTFVFTHNFQSKYTRPDYSTLAHTVCALIRSMDITAHETPDEGAHALADVVNNPLANTQGVFALNDPSWKPTPLPSTIAELLLTKCSLLYFLMSHGSADESGALLVQFCAWHNLKLSMLLIKAALTKLTTATIAEARGQYELLYLLMVLSDRYLLDRLTRTFEDPAAGVFLIMRTYHKSTPKQTYMALKFLAKVLAITNESIQEYLVDTHKAQWSFYGSWLESHMSRSTYGGGDGASNETSAGSAILERTQSALNLLEALQPHMGVDPEQLHPQHSQDQEDYDSEAEGSDRPSVGEDSENMQT
eukprot:m.888901 g.888901  ORF g.888901 m.888901 type:complete len:2301 (-) comp59937_c0_seq1:245-7147(-)